MDKLLSAFPEELKDKVRVILTEDAIEADLKKELLQQIVKDPQLLEQLFRFIDEKALDAFLDQITTPGKKEVMKLLLDRGDSAVVEKIIEKEDEDVKKAYKKWKDTSSKVYSPDYSFANTRNLITAMARPLAEIVKNHLVNKKLIEKRIQEIEREEKEGLSVATCISQKQAVIVPKKLDKPRTVCTAPSCCDFEKVNQFETRRIPKKICHDDCELKGVQEESVNNNDLLYCMIFSSGTGKCRVCGCDWKLHMYTTYEYIVDDNAKAHLLLQQEKDKMDELVRELDHIGDCTAEFSVFLSANSMKQSFDPYADYLDFLFKEEADKTVEGGAEELLFELWDVQENYAKRIGHIKKEIASGKRTASSTAELKNLIDSLSKLKLCGAIITKIKEFQAAGDKTDEQDDDGQRLSDDLKNVHLGPNGRNRDAHR